MSSNADSSFFCASAAAGVAPEVDGQSMPYTVATHRPRISHFGAACPTGANTHDTTDSNVRKNILFISLV